MPGFESFGGAVPETVEQRAERGRELLREKEGSVLSALGERAGKMKRFLIACTALVGIGASGDAFAAPASTGEAVTMHNLDGYTAANQEAQALYEKILSGEISAIPDGVPPPIVGDMHVVIPALVSQGLRLDTTRGIISDSNPNGTVVWAVQLLDQSGKIVGETASVELLVNGDSVEAHMINSDSSIDEVVYRGGKIVVNNHLAPKK